MNENNNHESTKKKLKITGFILLGGGIVLSLVGLINFFASFGTGEFPKLFFCAFIGFPLLGVGAGLLSFAFKREIMRYAKNESVPVINEASEEVSPAMKNVASAVKEGLGEKTVKCPHCGTENPTDGKFCKECGKAITTTCPECGAKVSPDDKFCGNCGAKLTNR